MKIQNKPAEIRKPKAPSVAQASPKRRRGNPNWKKGVSGNPGGRPKEEREVVEALRLEGSRLVAALLKLALHPKFPSVRAIEVALDRAYGKAKEKVELTGGDGGPVKVDLTKLTVEQLRQWRELVRAANSDAG